MIADLEKIGIKKENLIIREVGNYGRYKGKEFLISKQLELILVDFKKLDEITSTINTKGISYMRLGELKNKDLTEYRKQVKTEALKAAKNKAEYLLASLDKELGEVISIVEVNNNYTFGRQQLAVSNTVIGASGSTGIDNIRKIKLKYEIIAKFEIK